jgi:hypothetical protein
LDDGKYIEAKSRIQAYTVERKFRVLDFNNTKELQKEDRKGDPIYEKHSAVIPT